jgi:tetratricopeptide (TPR) repeat protein
MKSICSVSLLVFTTTLWGTCALCSPESDMDRATARGLVNHKNYKRAVPFLDHAIKLAPDDGRLYLDRGSALFWMEEYQRAMADFTTALKLDPKSSWKSYELRARCRSELGDFKAAVTDISNAIKVEKDPHNKAFLFKERATYYINLGQPDKAIADVDSAIATRPKEYYNYSRRAALYASLHQYQKAVEDYSTAIKLHDGRFDDLDRIYSSRANAYEKLGRKDLADKDRKQANIYADNIRPL